MSARQSAILVERAKTRRSIRRELWERCFVPDMTTYDVPEGWVAIERADQIDATRPDGSDYEVFESDEHAALAVCEIGGARGTAMHYAPRAGVWEPVSLDGCGTSTERWAELDAAALAIDPDHAIECPKWVSVVPRAVAQKAGLVK